MKYSIILVALMMVLIGCKNNTEARTPLPKQITKEDITTSIYPEAITRVFEAHGGIDQWNAMQTLSFTMERPNGSEVTTINLKTRAERIDAPTYSLGYDGNQLWLNKKTDTTYNGSPWFYKGLMMYFYAMPFIVGDNGINYRVVEPLKFDGQTYPGILISYEANIGESPEDEYIIYYDDKTGQMTWLAYTVTFGKNEKSKDFHFVRYNNWQTINNLLLPKSIDWYNYEGLQPTEKRSTIEFSNIVLTEEAPMDSLFIKPSSASYVERE